MNQVYEGAAVLLLGSFLLFSSWLDIKKQEVSVLLLLIYGIAGMVLFVVDKRVSCLSLIGGVAIGVVLIGISRITRGGIGLGDGGMVCITGIYLGACKNVELLLMALIYAAAWSVALIVLKKAKRKTRIPFVPFLALGYISLVVMSP